MEEARQVDTAKRRIKVIVMRDARQHAKKGGTHETAPSRAWLTKILGAICKRSYDIPRRHPGFLHMVPSVLCAC